MPVQRFDLSGLEGEAGLFPFIGKFGRPTVEYVINGLKPLFILSGGFGNGHPGKLVNDVKSRLGDPA